MTKKRKPQSSNPAKSSESRYRVQRSDGIVLARNLKREEAEEVAEQLRGKNTTGLNYSVRADGRPVIDLRDYLKQ